VLVTGHTGFKGSWLCAWLDQLGADLMGLSLEERVSAPNLWDELNLTGVLEVRADLASDGWQEPIVDFDPEIVIHLAAQAIVSRGYSEPFRTFATNVHGSVQLLQTFTRLRSAKAAVMVTTDKVYDPAQPIPFSESAFIGGRDPYSASKAAMELAVQAWPAPPFAVATARAGNVIGGGDWSTDRLLPDLLGSWLLGDELVLRRPTAVRPWQHVLEPLLGYLRYAEDLASGELPRALNFGPDESQCVPVAEVVAFAGDHWNSRGWSPSPRWRALHEPPMEETDLLVLDSRLAEETLGWSNTLDWRDAVRRTIDWHHAYATGTPAHELVSAEISDYVNAVEQVRK
jgi:CDP-glucose 4,6-dehydratase